MHELSIATQLVELASATAKENNASDVEAVYIKIGVLSGVIKEALLFSYDIATKNTPLSGSSLVVEEVPVVIECAACGEVELPDIQNFFCPKCNNIPERLVQGRELEISYIELN